MTSYSEDSSTAPVAPIDEQLAGAVQPDQAPPAIPAVDGAAADDESALDQLEVDLTAVEQAIETLDSVTAEGLGGEHAAAQIEAAVSAERFGTPADDPIST